MQDFCKTDTTSIAVMLSQLATIGNATSVLHLLYMKQIYSEIILHLHYVAVNCLHFRIFEVHFRILAQNAGTTA